MSKSTKKNNPFDKDESGTATHLSTWDMESKSELKFVWSKKQFRIISEYDYELNLVCVNVIYNGEQIKEISEPLYVQNPTVENITRTTQRIVSNYLESW